MSKRSGDLVTLADVVEEVGPDADALHAAVPAERRAARFRLRQGQGADPGQSGVLRAVRPCPRLLDLPHRRARPAGRSTSRPTALRDGRDRAAVDARRARADPARRAVAADRRGGRDGARAAPHRVLSLRPRGGLPRLLGQGQRGPVVTLR